MTNPLRMVVLAALAAFLVSSFPTGSAAVVRGIKCETSKDCPSGSSCKHKNPKKAGRCVARR
jgi:hypothetical protein